MARMLRWLLLLTLVLGVATVVVSADGWMPSFGFKSDQDKAKEAAAQSVDSAKSWTDWAANYVPSFSAKEANEKLDASKDTASDVAGDSEEKAKTAADTAREYAATSLERMTSTKDQLHGATKGFIQRWGSWAKDNVGKYYSYGPLASDKAKDVVDETASNVDSAADSSTVKEYVDSAKEAVLGKTEEKEL